MYFERRVVDRCVEMKERIVVATIAQRRKKNKREL
jgi:hypothetical protein